MSEGIGFKDGAHGAAAPSEKVARAVAAFRAQFDPGADPAELLAARAPGRVNLIGEHTDYNDGYVFPMAIDREVVVAGRRRTDGRVVIYSADYDARSEFVLDGVAKDSQAPWSNYFRGVVDVLQKEGYRLGGLEAVVLGDVPQGAGLSSSAAFEVSAVAFLDGLFELGIDPVRRALLAQRAENEFVGVQCGIMDQFASSLGKAGHALFIDCRTLEYERVPFNLSGATVMVVNTNKKRGLVDSEYNARRRECEEGAAYFAGRIPGVRALRDVTPEQFEAHASGLPQPVMKRCRHVVSECARVLQAVEALKRSDLETFGRLMYASHESLQRDFEVSCFELDTIVDIARQVPGVYGARMTGAGFGGCAVALVRESAAAELEARIRAEYPQKTGLEPEIFRFRPVDGAGVFRCSEGS